MSRDATWTLSCRPNPSFQDPVVAYKCSRLLLLEAKIAPGFDYVSASDSITACL